MNEVYPKIATLFALEHGTDGKRKWFNATDRLLPDTAALHCIPLEDLVITEKVDGSNMWIDIGDYPAVGKRSGQCDPHDKGDAFYFEAADPVIRAVQRARDVLEPFGKDGSFLGGLRLYGELAGPKVNGSGALLDEREFLLFDIQPRGSWTWFRWQAVKDYAALAGVRTVPQIDSPPYHPSFTEWQDFVTTLDSRLRPGVPAEGIVVRDGQDTLGLRRRIAKLRRKDFK